MTEIILNSILIALALGAAGGGVRIIISSIKRRQVGKEVSKNAFFIQLMIYLVIGALSGLLLNSSKVMSLLGGYMAVDLMDVYHKSFNKRKIK